MRRKTFGANQMNNAMKVNPIPSITSGCEKASHAPKTTSKPSTVLRMMFENGSGLWLMMRRFPAFVECPVRAMLPQNSPAMTDATGSPLPNDETPTAAAPRGRMTAWTAAPALSNQGVLSATNSNTYISPATPRMYGLLNTSSPESSGLIVISPNLMPRPTTSTVAYRFTPEVNPRPTSEPNASSPSITTPSDGQYKETACA